MSLQVRNNKALISLKSNAYLLALHRLGEISQALFAFLIQIHLQSSKNTAGEIVRVPNQTERTPFDKYSDAVQRALCQKVAYNLMLKLGSTSPVLR